MMNSALGEGRIQGIQLAQGGPELTQLFFADDALLFGKATLENMYQIVDILNSYSKASGQRINLSKSGMVGGKFMDHRLKIQLAAVLKTQNWENPGKYLGLPTDWGRSKVSALNWIQQRIEAKIGGWKECLLNQAGKETLIKAVLQAIPTYAMSMVRFPKNFCSKICSSIARFWWRTNGRCRGIHWKSWESLTSSKLEGGLGFKDFAHMNSSFLAKQAWRIIQNPDALWVRVLKALYFPNSEFLKAGRKRNESWVWASLIHGREIILKSARWVVGSGKSIDIQEDCWLASGDRVVLNENSELKWVSDIIDPVRKCWNVDLLKGHFPPSAAMKIIQTPIAWRSGEDTIWWPFSKAGDFTVKSGYYQAKHLDSKPNLAASASTRVPQSLWKEIWKVNIPQKIKFFLWKICHNILPVGESLRKRKIKISALCPLCMSENESIEHLFLFCDWTRMIWFGLQVQCVPNRDNITSIHDWISQRFREEGKEPGMLRIQKTQPH